MQSLLITTLVLLALDAMSGMLRHPSSRERPSPALREKTRYSNDWAVEVSGGVEMADQLAAKHGFINMGQVENFENHYRFQLLINANGTSAGSTYVKSTEYRHIRDRTLGSFAEIGLQSILTNKLQSENMVGRVEQLRIKRHSKKEFVHPSDPKFGREWSLLNTGQIGSSPFLDLNVERAWMQGITGEGVVVGFVDDGLEHTHPDLRGNYDSYASYDFVYHDGDPTPTKYTGDEPDRHGTSCAGEVGMSKDNNDCGVGVAYGCKISGLKLDLGVSEDLTESEALSYRRSHIGVYSNSWGPSDYGFVVEGPGYYLATMFEQGVKQGRNGLGSIFIWAAGNGGTYYDSCTADGYASSIYTIAVGSADQNGKQADYDEFCSSKMAVTFSYDSWTFPSADDKWDPYNQITTTTLNGECTDDFTGTSASTPLMSGVAALTLQANPQLTWRDMQYLIVYTSDTSNLVGGDWQINGGGVKVSHKFGFGAIDAEAMVTRARRWVRVPDKLNYTVQPSSSRYGTVYPRQSWTTTFNVQWSDVSIIYLEHVVVNMTLSIDRGGSQGYEASDYRQELYHTSDTDEFYQWLQDPHPRRGDIKVELTSPQGTVSTLLPYRNYDFVNEDGYSNWPFMSVQHWGEEPYGMWTLKVTYKSSSGSVSASGISLTLHGTKTIPSSVSAIPASCDKTCARNCSGSQPSYCDTCKDYRVALTLECVSACPSNTYVHNRYCLSGTPQPDHKIVYPSDHHVSKFVYIGSGVAGLFLLVIITGVVAGLIIARKRSKRSTGGRGFHYAPIAPAAV